MSEEMIFRELYKTETQVLKLLKLHLTLGHLELSRYMEMKPIDLHKPMNHLEREGLITSRRSSIHRENIYCPTAKGLCLVRW